MVKLEIERILAESIKSKAMTCCEMANYKAQASAIVKNLSMRRRLVPLLCACVILSALIVLFADGLEQVSEQQSNVDEWLMC